MKPMKQRATPQWLFHFRNAVAAIQQARSQSVWVSSMMARGHALLISGCVPLG